MNDRLDCQSRGPRSQPHDDDWASSGGSWGQTLPALTSTLLPRGANGPTGSGPGGVKGEAALTGSHRRITPVRPTRSSERVPPADQADVAVIDWDDLLGAVKARLLSIAAGATLPMAGASPGGPGALQVGVLDCVNSLEHLHITMSHEVERRRELEIEASNARAALALLRSQLLGGRGGTALKRTATSTDELTGLPDLTSFQEHLRQALLCQGDRKPVIAVMLLDLDGFGAVNDLHGHAIGDALLRIVAARLVRALRGDDVVSRQGGDEFSCLLADVPSRDQLSHLACKLFDSIAAPISIGTLQLTVRPSIGIAICPDDGSVSQALLASAEAACRRAKRQGSGYAYFDPPIPTNPVIRPAR